VGDIANFGWLRSSIIVGLVLVACVVQVVVVSPLQLPGAPPDLLLLVIAAIALALGPLSGAIVGFLAGLTADLVPPADHLLGRYALVFCLIGYAVGLLRHEASDSVPISLAAVAIAAAAATVLYGLLGGLLSDERVSTQSLANSVPWSVAYDVVLAPFVVPWVMSVMRRTDPEVAHR
jgi:rod shape-determining protein MreD